ncbi:MAG: hypothetical protein OHK0053_27550 [Microscillaceae bacterium]
MKVSTTQPFQIVYSLFQHEYLGYLFESFVVQMNGRGEFTFQHQNISSQNAREFSKALDETDFEIIRLIENIQQEHIIRQFYHKKIKAPDFFLKVYNPEKGDKNLRKAIEHYIDEQKAKIVSFLRMNRHLFVMGKDGNPTWRRLHFAEEGASVLFHVHRNADNTHYFPTIRYKGQKLDFQYKHAFILVNEPACLVLNHTLYHFSDDIDGNKIKPFLHKKFIVIPQKLERTYYRKFIAPLMETGNVRAVGLGLKELKTVPIPHIRISEHHRITPDLFSGPSQEYDIHLRLSFHYGSFSVEAHDMPAFAKDCKKATVKVCEESEGYVFYRIWRNWEAEQHKIQLLNDWGLRLQKGECTVPKAEAFRWIGQNAESLRHHAFQIVQDTQPDKRYFLGEAILNLEIIENHDWFDIHARIRFGEFEIPFLKLRKLIMQKKNEFTLPNGEIAVIPDTWLEQYAELFAFSETRENGAPTLNKHHLTLLDELQTHQRAKIKLASRLEHFKNLEQLPHYRLPLGFEGTLRSYQQAGYNWLRFLHEFGFGGCLADDMGLGKTVQTLALLQAQKEMQPGQPSLLVIPTSLIYNWELEARKFTPQLKILTYTGTHRNKDLRLFDQYDLIITSYGIVRIDVDILSQYWFHYIILDESQAIKNPGSNISQAVRELKSRHRLILTGTPLENSTLDLWSQMSFANPGLLGSQSFFKNEFLHAIERRKDTEKAQKLARIIKPFILRRLKSQVALDLPEKIENVQYCLMSAEQAQMYERVKSSYRNRILEEMEQQGLPRSQFLLLQGLTKLRQIANHPRLAEPDYQGDSGKMEDVRYKLENLLSEHHKVLIFSQFVKHLRLLRDYLDQQNIGYAYLDGATRQRQAEVDKFQQNPQCPVFLISLKAGGVGLNLTAADYVFLLDPWWNPAVEAQAIDRAHRIGQTNRVFTYKFITRDTVEEKILALQQHKRLLAQEIISNEESFIKSLTPEDVMELLR